MIVPRDQIKPLLADTARGRPTKTSNECTEFTNLVRVKTLTPIYKMIAQMIALGYSNSAIAAETGHSSNRVSVIRHSPVVRDEVRRLTAGFDPDTAVDVIRKRMFATLSDSIERCVELRDTAEEEAVQAGMAKFLVQTNVDITVPKKQVLEEQKRVAVVVLKTDDINEFKQIMAEDASIDSIDIDAIDIEAESGVDGDDG